MRNKIYAMAVMGLAIGCFYSCSEDHEGGPEGERLTQAELQLIINTDDISGIADDAISDLFNASTAKAPTAKDNECYSAVYSDTGFEATFLNCELNGTKNINGTISVTYAIAEGSTSFTASYDNFSVGGITINGTRTFTVALGSDENTGSFTVSSEMSIEFEDGSTISESGSKTFTIGYNEATESLILEISGAWTVQTDEHTYIVETIDDLQGSSSCQYLTLGTMSVSKNGLEVIVDFGDGRCDDKATLIYPNGATEEISL